MLIYIAVIWLTCGLWAFTHELRSGEIDKTIRERWHEDGTVQDPPNWAIAIIKVWVLIINLLFGTLAAFAVYREGTK